MNIQVVGETRHMFVVDVNGMKVRVPKDPNRIPEGSIYIFSKDKKGGTVKKDVTPEVKKVVEKHLAKKEKDEEG
ncbi:MAG: hypothetical protein ACXQS2_01005 [Methermicoccaceae archaeon]